jgi:hypothetical protein
MSSILQWCGRFGNNIQQISNAIFYCKENNLNFLSPDNELIKPFNIKFGNTYTYPRLYFFHVPSELGHGDIGNPDFIVDVNNLKRERRNICKDMIYENLKINFNNVKKIKDDVVVMHIRSGDIFSKKNHYCNVVSNYLQNPLSFYINIAKEFNKVIVITEDFENPVISELDKLNNVEIKFLSTVESIELLLSAQNIVTSGVSSFGIACALLSKNIKNLYCTNLYKNEILNYQNFIDTDVKIILTCIDQNRYIKWNEWLNTEEQRKLMIEYVL